MDETQAPPPKASKWKKAGDALRGFKAAGEAIIATHEMQQTPEKKDAQLRRRAKALDDERAARAAPLHFGDIVCAAVFVSKHRFQFQHDGWKRGQIIDCFQ